MGRDRLRAAGATVAAALALAAAAAGCGGGSDAAAVAPARDGHEPPVVVGSASAASGVQARLAGAYAHGLAARGYRVRLRRVAGGAAALRRAFLSGKVDLYVEQVRAFDRQVAHRGADEFTTEDAYAAGRDYAFAHGYELLALTPFAAETGLAVRPGGAGVGGASSITDLRRIPHLRIGVPASGTASDRGELRARLARYGLRGVAFVATVPGQECRALVDGRADVVASPLREHRLACAHAILADPRGALHADVHAVVGTRAMLQLQGPGFRDALEAIASRLG
jgi:glycine betaine/choline ABC-type transport system substrate-binding protein